MRELLAICYLLSMLAIYASCDEGDVMVNNNLTPPDSVLSPCPPETVWAPMPCPPETVWVMDPFWDCVKECERTGLNRNSRGYRRCMEDCLGDLR